ncbi:MAG: TetR/AcrR family transcriptional regulator [Chitinophagales bacterium]
MKKKTKNRIIETAIRLFNEQGFGAISLHEIAQQLSISRGNLTYHFPTKDALLQVISTEMWQKIEVERQKRRDFPSFENIYNETKLYYSFQQEYAFIFNDLHVITHPILEEKFREFCLTTIKDNHAAIAFAIKLGNMRPEPFAGAYYNLSLSIWTLALFGLPQQTIRKVKKRDEVMKVVWSLILPHFTLKGIESFKSFFGEDFYNSMGEPFEVNNLLF